MYVSTAWTDCQLVGGLAAGVRLGGLGALILYIKLSRGTHGYGVPATSAILRVCIRLLPAVTQTEREKATRQQMCVCF